MLRAAGEATRLRILALLATAELNVKDLTQILGQSQPRISRHLKLMAEAGLITRFREGSWVFFRLAESGAEAALAAAIVASLDPSDLTLARDRSRAAVGAEGARRGGPSLFQDACRRVGQDPRPACRRQGGREPPWTRRWGRGPSRFSSISAPARGASSSCSAPAPAASLGFDLNHDMLAYARMKLERAGLSHAQVRHGDLYNVPLPDGAADAVVLHQVLHFLDDPAAAIAEAARLLRPGGKLLVVDFAPHELEFLREQSAHRRLGFARDQLGRWLEAAGLKLERFRELAPSPRARQAHRVALAWPEACRRRQEEKDPIQCGGRRLMLASTEPKRRILGRGAIDVSFEFFPPKTAAMEETLWRSIRRLEPLRPRYVSVTYGAGGSTRERTHATVARILRETTLKPAAHLTCVAATKRGARRRHPRLLGLRRPPYRGAPRRSAGRRRRPLSADARRLYQRRRPREGHQAHRAVRDLGCLLSREAS